MNNSEKTWSVYVLRSPKDNSVRYVGISKRPKERLASHIRDRSKTHKVNWITSLRAEGLVPRLQVVLTGLTEEKAELIEVSLGKELSSVSGAKLTNNISALGSKPPIRYGVNNTSAKKRLFKVWNDTGKEYFFNYQFEVKEQLGQKAANGIYRVLNGKRKSVHGFYACFMDEIELWVKPKGNTGSGNPSARRRPFKIWTTSPGREWFFNYQFEAVDELGLEQRTVSQMLRRNQYTKGKYYACYVDLLGEWTPPTDRRVGLQSNLSRKKPFKIWDGENVFSYDYQFEAVRDLRLCDSGLSMLLSEKLKTHRGYKACYVASPCEK